MIQGMAAPRDVVIKTGFAVNVQRSR